MDFKQITQLLIPIFAIGLMATAVAGVTDATLIYSGLLAQDKILTEGKHNDTPIIAQSESKAEAKSIFEQLQSIINIYEAQESTNVDVLTPVLNKLVEDACKVLQVKLGNDTKCSSYSDILDIKLKLELYFLTAEAIENLVNYAGPQSDFHESWLKAIPCKAGSTTPLDIISSLDPTITCGM